MKKNHRQNNKKKTSHRIFLLILFTVITIAVIFCLLFVKNKFNDKIIINPTNHPQSSSMNADWNLTLVNKWTPLPENYEITLVKVPGGEKVDERIYKPLMQMLEAAKKENWNQLPEVVSGYRTSKTQEKLYNKKVTEFKQQGYSEENAVEQAEQWVSLPGYSEHQLGIAVDITGATYELYFWLQENAHKYGFIFRYPSGKTEITGVAEEVWHYRYVGIDAAKKIYEQGLCFEEYLSLYTDTGGGIR